MNAKSITRRFIHDSQTCEHLHRNDLVLVIVPEEMEILCTVPACAHGQLGHIMDISDNCEDVKVALRHKPSKNNCDIEFPVRDQRDFVVNVPKFCLWLEERVLADRIRKI